MMSIEIHIYGPSLPVSHKPYKRFLYMAHPDLLVMNHIRDSYIYGPFLPVSHKPYEIPIYGPS